MRCVLSEPLSTPAHCGLEEQCASRANTANPVLTRILCVNASTSSAPISGHRSSFDSACLEPRHGPGRLGQHLYATREAEPELDAGRLTGRAGPGESKSSMNRTSNPRAPFASCRSSEWFFSGPICVLHDILSYAVYFVSCARASHRNPTPHHRLNPALRQADPTRSA